ncbi:fusion protein [Agrobacterium radiobacter]|uniref:fusion protein n=1 Tax=Agrobacterium radiobacter TaxID=362 RepID=UPI003CE4C699
MANTTWYGDGTATVAVGSRTVTGTDTGWLTEVAGLTPIKVGDKFGIHVGRPIVIEQIISDTELLLADDWPGPAQTDAPYKVELTSPTIAAVEAMRRLLASLSNGNLDSLSEITVGTDDIPIGIGPGVFGTISKFELKDGVQFDEAVPDLAGRAAYDAAAADFRVLVANIGDGRSALYIKNSATSGDWSVPYPITGPVGPAGVNQRGNYSAGTAYAIRDIVQYGGSTWIAKVATTGNAPPTLPVTENTQWLLFARSGTPGVVDRGTYSGATAYEANDIVLNNGSTWIALQSTTGNAPPTLPTESNAYWRLLARKGTDGSGTGDVVGPASAVDNFPVAFDATTGKLIKAITGAIAALHALTPAADKLPYFSGASAASLADLTAFARTILDDANGAAMFTTMGATSGTGWMKLPNGRLFQHASSIGTTDSGGNLGISFPTAFASGTSYNVVAWSGDSGVLSGKLLLSQLRSAPWPQAAGFAVNARQSNDGAPVVSGGIRVDWIAIGTAP